MITCPSYYNRLREAVDLNSVVVLKSVLDEIRAHYLAFKSQEEPVQVREMRTAFNATVHLIDVRGEEDFTVLMYACARYAMFKRQGKVQACAALEPVVAWLIEQGAVLMNEGGRPIERTTSRDGRPTFRRGRGRNVVELLGQSNLPPSAQAVLDAVDDFDGYYERRAYARWEDSVAA